jgi:hypothetical protein
LLKLFFIVRSKTLHPSDIETQTGVRPRQLAAVVRSIEFTTNCRSANPAPPWNYAVRRLEKETASPAQDLLVFDSTDGGIPMIRKLTSGEFRLYSRKKNPKTGMRRNLGTFKTRAAAEQHEREVQYFKRSG